MIYVYKLTAYILLVFSSPIILLLWLFSSKRRANLLPRLGFNTGIRPKSLNKKRIWVHALSVGEVASSGPFIKALKKKLPLTDIVFTASTKTGFDMAEKLFQNSQDQSSQDKPYQERLIDQLGYFPFDIGFSIQKVQSRIGPDAVVIVETDLWPNFLHEMKKKNIPVILINARLSERSLKGYRFFKSFSSLMFSSLTSIMAQSDLDRQRFEQLGIDKKKIQITGNIKFDQTPSQLGSADIRNIKSKLFLKSTTRIIIAGSTHEGEEEILVAAFKKIRENFSDLIMIIVPRDIRRVKEIESCCHSFQLSSRRMSGFENTGEDLRNTDILRLDTTTPDIIIPADIIIVDKMGVLSKLYAVCDIAFIGGSLVKQGGHNPLEAAAASKPVVFGPDMSDFVSISNLLMNNGGARQVEDETQVSDAFEALLSSERMRKQMGNQNFKIFCEHSGAVQRIIEQMEHLNIV